MARTGMAPGGVDFLQDPRAGTNWQARAAILLRDQRGEVARFGQFMHELLGIDIGVFHFAPVAAGIFLADRTDRVANFPVVFAQWDHRRVVRHIVLLRLYQAILRLSRTCCVRSMLRGLLRTGKLCFASWLIVSMCASLIPTSRSRYGRPRVCIRSSTASVPSKSSSSSASPMVRCGDRLADPGGGSSFLLGARRRGNLGRSAGGRA